MRHAAALAVLLAGCDLTGPLPPPPPPPPPNLGATTEATGGAGTVEVTVNASSTPTGATVNGGGRLLGTTPLTAVVPIPRPTADQPPQTFDFIFTKDGYEPTTVQAAPVNNIIEITAALSRPGSASDTDSPGGRTINARGRGGGRIFDNHTTTAAARVTEACIVRRANIRIRGNHSFHSDMTVTLDPPAGGNVTIQRRQNRTPFRNHRINGVRGKQARGTWTLSIRDDVQQDTGRLRNFTLRIVCQP